MSEQKVQDKEIIYALDIGTRSVVGVVGVVEEDRLRVLDIEMAEHSKRTMIDGQIDNIRQVGALARTVTDRLQERLGIRLERVCVAAAGRALRTQTGTFRLELEEGQRIDAEQIGELEAGAVSAAEDALQMDEETKKQFFLVGYTVAQYRLDGYPLTVLVEHTGRKVEADVVATFLPGEVVESLYAAMRDADLQVASMTLEPIAAMNAAIPAELRLLNLALVDIGAGTTDIATCKDGSVVGYTMATIAGDEISEAIMHGFLVDFKTAEMMKCALVDQDEISYVNILGLEETATRDEVYTVIQEPLQRLAEAISKHVLDINGVAPPAVFLAGGGSRMAGLQKQVAKSLGLDEKRVAIAGSNFSKSAFSDTVKLDNPEYTTPLGIAISAGMGLLHDSYVVMLNGQAAKLFRSGTLVLRDVLLMNGYSYSDMVGRSGKTLTFTLDGKRMTFYGEPSVPAILKLNDEEVSAGTMVHAGDRIQFTPARHGADVVKTVKDVLAPGFQGKVLINNNEVSLDTQIKTGDVILTMKNISPNLEPVQLDKVEPPVRPEPTPVRSEVSAHPELPVHTEKAERSSPKEQSVSPRSLRAESMPAPEQKPTPAAMTPSVATESKPESKREMHAEPVLGRPGIYTKRIHITLNGKARVLEPKKDGQPYYMMDLLEYSELDFEHLERPVRMEINGEEQGFLEIVRDHDAVVICYAD